MRGVVSVVESSDLPGCCNAIHVGHAHVHEHDIGVELFDESYGFAAIAGLTNNCHIRLRVDDHGKTGAHERLIVSNHNRNGHSSSLLSE